MKMCSVIGNVPAIPSTLIAFVHMAPKNKHRLILINQIFILVTILLTNLMQFYCMFFPVNFNLEELESYRRRHIILAATATAVPIMQMHLSLAELYQYRARALQPAVDRDEIGEVKRVSGLRRSIGR